MSAQLVNEANGFGIPNFYVVIEPASGVGETISTITDPLGMIHASLLPGTYNLRVTIPVLAEPQLGTVVIEAGETTHRRYPLAVPDLEEEEALFELAFQVTCVRSQSPLPDADIQVTFRPAEAGAAAAAPITIRSDANGFARLPRLKPGFYEFHVTRPGWEDYSFPGNGGVLIEGRHGILAALKPVETSLSVTVQGRDPKLEAYTDPSQFLSNALVEITGLSFAGEDVETIPPQQGYTDGEGNVTFTGLPAIPWKVEVKKTGYEPLSVIVQPNQNEGTLTLDPLLLPLHMETRIIARFSISDAELNEGLNDVNSPLAGQVRVRGLKGTATEGVDRYTTISSDGTATLYYLLPGRYQVTVETMVYRDFDYRDVRLVSGPRTIEVADQEERIVEFELEPIPAPVSGRVLVLEDPPGMAHLANGTPGLRGHSSSRIEFRRVLRDDRTAPPIVTAADAEGFFSVVLPPGFYLIEIPDLTGFSEREIHWGHADTYSNSGQPRFMFTSSWPGADSSGPFRIQSGFSYRLDLVIAPNHVHLTSPIAGSLDRLAYLEGLQVHLEGPVNQPFTINNGMAVFTNVPAGSYIIRGGSSDYYDFIEDPGTGRNDIAVTIPAWSSYPGAFDGDPPSNFLAGESHQVEGYLQARFRYPDSVPILETRTWNEDDQSYGSPVELEFRFVFAYSLPEYPDVFWETAAVPHIPGVIAHTMVGKWRTHAFSPGQERITLFIGGPADNGRDPNEYLGTLVGLRIRTYFESGDEITGVTWTDDPVTLTSGEDFVKVSERTMNRLDLGAVEVPFRLLSSSVEVVSSNPYQAEAALIIGRDLHLSGMVLGFRDDPLTNVTLRLYDKLGRPVNSSGSLQTDENGTFDIGLPQRGDPVIIEILERGYKPFRKLYQPASDTADLTGLSLVLEPLPPPGISDLTLNRFGLFIPGVSKSGDSTDYRTGTAKSALTATWGAKVEVSPISYQVDQVTDGVVSTRTVQREDVLQELWLVDRKALFDSDNNPVLPNIFAGVETNLFDPVDELLGSIFRHEWNEEKFDVSFQRLYISQANEENLYSGTIYLPNLPPGVFEPYIVAVTKAGAVAVAPYAYPEGRVPLEGWELPSWIDEGFLNTIGTINNYRVRNLDSRASLQAYFPKGALLPLPEFTGKISLAPVQTGSTPDPAKENYLNYAYSISVKSTIGIQTPKTGSVLSLGGAKIGAETGGSLSLTAKGKEKEAELAFSGFLNREFATTNLLDRPAVTRGQRLLKKIGEAKIRAEGKDSMKFTAKISELSERHTITHSHLTFYEVQVLFNLTEKAIFVAVPYVGLIFLTLDTLDIPLPFKATFGAKFGGGADHQYSWETVQPRPLNLITTTDGPPRVHFLGTEGEKVIAPEVSPGPGWDLLPSSERTDLLFIAGAELKGSLGADTGAGIGGSFSGVLQLGPPDGSTDRGVRVKMNPGGEGSPLVEVAGAITGGFNWKVNLLGLQYGASPRWNLFLFQWQFGTEPYHSIYPLPEIEVITPQSAAVAVWTGKPDTLVTNFFAAGTMDLSHGASPGLVFTQTDPAGGMKLMVSAWKDGSFTAPVVAAETEGIVISAALSRLPAAQAPFGWALCWSEIAPEDIGNPMAPSRIQCSISTDAGAGNWDPPRELAAVNTPAVKLDLQRNANRLILVWLEPETTLLEEARAIRIMSSSTLNQWTTPQTAFPAANQFVECQFTTSPAFLDYRFALAARHRDGWIYGWEFRDSEFNPLPAAGERHSPLPRLFYGQSGELFNAAFAASEEALTLSRLEADSWTELSRISPIPEIHHFSATSVNGENGPRILLSWRTEGLMNEFWQAWFHEDGTVLRDPEAAEADPSGVVSAMLLAPLETGAALVYQLSNDQGSSIRMTAMDPDALPSVVLGFEWDPGTGSIRLAWPEEFSEYRLERSAAVGSNADWQAVPGAELSGGVYQYLIEPSGERQFFRLKK